VVQGQRLRRHARSAAGVLTARHSGDPVRPLLLEDGWVVFLPEVRSRRQDVLRMARHQEDSDLRLDQQKLERAEQASVHTRDGAERRRDELVHHDLFRGPWYPTLRKHLRSDVQSRLGR